MNKKILLTGGTGFLGSHLVSQLPRICNDISLLVRKFPLLEIGEEFQFLVSSSPSQVFQEVQNLKPDVVIHLAALYSYADKPKEATNMVEANIALGINLLNAVPHGTTFIYCGTYMQYLYTNSDFSNFYTATKSTFDNFAKYYAKTRNLKVRQLILSDIYGPGDKREKIIPQIITSLKLGADFEIRNPKSIVYPIYVSDVVEFILKLVSESKDEGIQDYYFVPSISLTVQDLFDNSNQVFASKKVIRGSEIPINLNLPKNVKLIYSKTSLEEGLGSMFSKD